MTNCSAREVWCDGQVVVGGWVDQVVILIPVRIMVVGGNGKVLYGFRGLPGAAWTRQLMAMSIGHLPTAKGTTAAHRAVGSITIGIGIGIGISFVEDHCISISKAAFALFLPGREGER